MATDDENAFQYAMRFTSPYRDWYRDFGQRFGEQPDLNTPDYNTRAAFQYGAQPAPYAGDDNHYHWPSAVMAPPRARPMELKSDEHPTRWMQTFMERYGTDPNYSSPLTMAQSLQDNVVPVGRTANQMDSDQLMRLLQMLGMGR